MLANSPNGLLSFPVAKYGVDFVAIPNNAELYKRQVNTYN